MKGYCMRMRPPLTLGGRSAAQKSPKIWGVPQLNINSGSLYGDTCKAWPPKTHRSGAHAEHEGG